MPWMKTMVCVGKLLDLKDVWRLNFDLDQQFERQTSCFLPSWMVWRAIMEDWVQPTEVGEFHLICDFVCLWCSMSGRSNNDQQLFNITITEALTSCSARENKTMACTSWESLAFWLYILWRHVLKILLPLPNKALCYDFQQQSRVAWEIGLDERQLSRDLSWNTPFILIKRTMLLIIEAIRQFPSNTMGGNSFCGTCICMNSSSPPDRPQVTRPVSLWDPTHPHEVALLASNLLFRFPRFHCHVYLGQSAMSSSKSE